MKRIILPIITLGIAMLSPVLSFSQGPAAEMFMRNVGAGKYEVTAFFYRDCRTVSLSTISFSVSATGVTTEIVSTNRTSIEEVSFNADSYGSQCTPTNTYGTGYGFERHAFVDTIDFNAAPFNTTGWQNACNITVGFGQCCRNGAITTGQGNANFYTDMTFNKCLAPTNNTPRSYADPLFIAYLSQPLYYNFDIRDVEGDSFSVNFVAPRSNKGVSISYGTSNLCGKPFSNDMQMTPYQSNPCGPLITNPKSNPPHGMYLDPKYGQLVFIPSQSNELGIISIEITEWIKDNNGIYQVASKTYKESEVTVHSVGNYIPTMVSADEITVYAGKQNCATFNFKDDAFGTSNPDTLDVSWSDTIAGASFTVNQNNRLKPATFCWTPTCNDVRTEPYTFIINAKDNFSQFEGRMSRVVKVYVRDAPAIDLGPTKNACVGSSVDISVDSTLYKSILWSTNDTTGKITVNTAGTYSVQTTSHCNTITSDSVNVVFHAKPVFDFPKDTNICMHDSFTAKIEGGNPTFIIWNSSVVSDSFVVTGAGDYRVQLTGGYCGYMEDSFSVKEIKYPNINLGPDQPTCNVVNKTLSVAADSITSILWSTNESTPSIFVTQPAKYWVTVTTLCGVDRDTIDFSDNTPPLNLNLGPDTLVCDDDDITLSSNIVGDSYEWSNLDNKMFTTVTQPGFYILRVDKCQQFAYDTIQVLFGNTPIVDLGMDIETDSPFSVELDAGISDVSYLWSTNANTRKITVTEPGDYWVEVGNNCGTDRDTVNVSVLSVNAPKTIAEKVEVYPNPVNSSQNLAVRFTDAKSQDIDLVMISLTGEVVYEDNFEIKGNITYTIPVEHLAKGIYFIKLTGNKGSATVKVVVN